MDKTDELAERIDRLEKKTKATFLEVERRLSLIPDVVNIPEAINERMTELEDLLLLAQVESSKLKEKVAGTQNLEKTDTGDVEKRVEKLEEKIYSLHEAQATPAGTADYSEDVEHILSRLDELDEKVKSPKQARTEEAPSDINDRLTELEDRIAHVATTRQNNSMSSVSEDLERSLGVLGERIKRLETRKPVPVQKPYSDKGKVIIMPDKNVLLDVQKILEGN